MAESTVIESRNKYIVRHGAMRFLGEFEAPDGLEFTRLDRVIIESERGLEAGEVLAVATVLTMAGLAEPTHGKIIRRMTKEDIQKDKQIQAQKSKDYDTATQLIMDHQLCMQMVDVERMFGGERIIFYFLSEKRVDFRELVRSMAREFQTRIELRQIGVRDEAKLLADFGDCGKPVCCNTHMAVMPPVSMRMAKIQKSTLDPNKISGRCGRLKCCLRFEQDVYDDFQKDLPNIGEKVSTKKGAGKVLAQEILARRLLVEFEDGRRLPVTLDELLTN